ncbi:Crp/Fnr family transcriptional regulator [Azospirillum sp. YIM B02556]|uniref:Crp/Fnr family transcriptional regulator n=1 Tax=Azospirillum endophyticum TaxID=2800326 RepID=A0ABS1EZV9_9PROT|nr:Crp/Fnr family transcriptional regulator [Azospirillum endophyticum]MBK1836696.1 Crp/Fnr family transcriptional regulator [Azospirillum endophyticum]
MTVHSPRLAPRDWRRIRSAAPFASLSDGDFAPIADRTRCETRREGQTLFFQDEPAEAFFVVLDGWVVLSRDRSDGTRTVIRIVGPGESFAEAMIAEGARYPVGAEAACPLRVARFETARLRALVAATPGLGLSIVAATFRQMHRLVDQIEHLKSWPADRRVAAMLLRMCDCRADRDRVSCDEAGSDAGSCRFDLPVSQRLIAAKLSITPSTLSRSLKRLEALGVTADRGCIAIGDTARLARFAAGQGGERCRRAGEKSPVHVAFPAPT